MESITITTEQFKEAIVKANEKWKAIGDKALRLEDPTIDILMGLQNAAFGAILMDILFEINDFENIEED